jgi:hypothetical protein
MIVYDNSNAGTLVLKSPESGTTTLTFPTSNGTTGQTLVWSNSNTLEWSSVQTSAIVIAMGSSTSSTTQVLVSSQLIPAGNYATITAVLGATSSFIATLTIKQAGNVVATISRTGSVTSVTTTGILLTADTLLDFYLSVDNGSAVGQLYGITFQ